MRSQTIPVDLKIVNFKKCCYLAKASVFTMVSAYPRIEFPWVFFSQITKNRPWNQYCTFGYPIHEQITKITPKWIPRGSQNPHKSTKNLSLDPKVSHWRSMGVPRTPKWCHGVPKWSPRVPKWSQNGALGYPHGAKMVPHGTKIWCSGLSC